MAIDTFYLEKVCAKQASRWIKQVGYDPVEVANYYAKNPDEIDINALRRIREEQVLLEKVKILFYYENLTPKEISSQLQRPVRQINSILKSFRGSEEIKIRQEQVKLLYQNKRTVSEIAALLNLKPIQITAWLAEMGLIEVPTTTKKVPKKKSATPVPRLPHSQQLKQQVQRMCLETQMTYAEIAKQVGLPRRTVNTWCRELGKVKQMPYTRQQKRQARRLLKEGHPPTKVAKELKISLKTIKRWDEEE